MKKLEQLVLIDNLEALYVTMGHLRWQSGRESACQSGRHQTCGFIPGLGRFLRVENSSPPQYSCLGSPLDRGAQWATAHGVTKSWIWLNTNTHTHTQQLLILLFSNAHGKLMKKISCMLGHEENLNKFEKIRILHIKFYDPSVIKLQSVTFRYQEKFQTTLKLSTLQIRSDQITHSVVSDSWRPHEPQHARPPCPSPTPGVHSDSCPSSQ